MELDGDLGKSPRNLSIDTVSRNRKIIGLVGNRRLRLVMYGASGPLPPGLIRLGLAEADLDHMTHKRA